MLLYSSDTSYPYCGKYSLMAGGTGYSSFGCFATSPSGDLTAYETFNADAATMASSMMSSMSYMSMSSSSFMSSSEVESMMSQSEMMSSSDVSVASASTSGGGGGIVVIPTATSGPAVSSAAGRGSSGQAEGAAGTTSSGDNGGSSTNVGAIAGGVVGGVVGLALIGGLIWFFMRRSKKNKSSAPKQEDTYNGGLGPTNYQNDHAIPPPMAQVQQPMSTGASTLPVSSMNGATSSGPSEYNNSPRPASQQPYGAGVSEYYGQKSPTSYQAGPIQERYEMDGTSQPHELDSSGQAPIRHEVQG